MPASTPVFGEGTVLEIDDGASNAYAGVPGLTSLDPPDETTPVVERKILSATDYVRKATGVPDAGEFSYEFESTDVEYARHRALKGPPAPEHNFRVTFVDGLRLAFKAKVTSCKINSVKGGNEIVSCKVMAVVTSLVVVTDTIANP